MTAPNLSSHVMTGELTLDNESVQRLLDYGVLQFDDGKWVVARTIPAHHDGEVERVAIECHHASCANVPEPRADYQRDWYPWEGIPENGKQAWRAVARAAIAAQVTK